MGEGKEADWMEGESEGEGGKERGYKPRRAKGRMRRYEEMREVKRKGEKEGRKEETKKEDERRGEMGRRERKRTNEGGEMKEEQRKEDGLKKGAIDIQRGGEKT